MTESSRNIYNSDPGRLLEMMDQAATAGRIWTSSELGAILRHQLSAPVEFDLGQVAPQLATKLRTLASSQGLLLKSFADLLHHPDPPLELLDLTRSFSKALMTHPDSPLPREVATVLYYASILIARIRCGKRISGLGDDALKEGLQWALDQSWLDASTRQLFREGLRALAAAQDARP